MFEKQVTRSLRRHVMAGVATVVFLSVGVAGWASTQSISGAVVTPGQLIVETSVKKVQHPTGGVVGELLVQEGSRVKAGDVVVRLDETQTRADLEVILNGLDENMARRARMDAELSGGELKFPASIRDRSLIESETDFYRVRRAARDGLKATLQEQIKGLREQIQGKDRELQWIKQELIGVHQLWEKNLVPFTRVVQLERDQARIIGERGTLVATIAATELKILQVDEDMRTDTGREMADVRAKISELMEKRVSAEDKLKRVDIRAPQDGIVHQLQVHTVGGVVAPPNAASEPIMLIVPESDGLVVEAKARPEDVDQLHVGQTARLRFTSFNHRTTPELEGEVSMVSADVTVDPKRDASYYTIRVKFSMEEAKKLGGARLVAGMPVEVFVTTEARNVLSYLIKPLRDQITRAFRER
jgi:HlyD family secretion protein